MGDRDEAGRFVAGHEIGAATRFTDGNPGGKAGVSGPPENTHNLTHGGEAAVAALRDGKPFTGLAAQTEQRVRTDLAELGTVGMVRREVLRLATCAELYWSAVQKAAEAGDLEKLDRYVARFGWLAGATLRGWAQLAQAEKEGPPTLDYDELVKKLEKRE